MQMLPHEIINFLEINKENLCYCGSGKNYGECCLFTPHKTWLNYEEYNRINPDNYNGIVPPSIYSYFIFGLNKKCLVCEKNAIKSHTISANRLRKSFKSDFVSEVLPDKNHDIFLKKVPINKASAMPLRCKTHDEIFNPIDDNIDLSNIHHLNLLAYRAVGREYSLLNGIIKISYSKNILFNNPNYWQHAEYYKRILEMYDLHKYIYNGIQNFKRNGLHHKIYDLGNIHPVFMSVAIHYDREKDWRLKKHIIALTIVTINGKGYFIISFKRGDDCSKNYCKIFDEFKNSPYLINLLNSYIGRRCENIICDESRDGEFIQSPSEGLLWQHGEHDYIIRIN